MISERPKRIDGNPDEFLTPSRQSKPNELLHGTNIALGITGAPS